jgi:two-component system, OmpR family, phosphate regulon sensor histidine kinase PhoR
MTRHLPLRWRITLAFALVMAAVFVLLEAWLQEAALNAGTASMAQSLRSETELVAHHLASQGGKWQRSQPLARMVRDLDQRCGARLTLIGGEGEVLADSRDRAEAMENHARRPERLQAIAGGWGQAVRHSATLGVDMLYVAQALPGSGSPPVVLRLAEPMTTVREASLGLRRIMLGALILVLVLVWAVSFLLAGALTAPVQSLVRVARRVDRGDLRARVEDVKGAELGELAAVFNAALDRLGELAATSQRESRYYAAILEQMSDAVIIVDRAGRVQFLNPTFARLLAVPAEETQGRPAEEITLNYQLTELLRRAAEQNSVQRDEVRLVHPEPRVLAAAVTPLVDEQGQVMGAIGLLRDVTDRRQVEEMRRDFVSNASHELRTPAAGVKALAEALQMGALADAERAPRFVQQIVEAADRLTNILDDMLILTRVERGQELLQATWLAAREALGEAADQVRPAAEAKGVRIEVQAPEADRLYADAGGLLTILLNLLDNAVKHTPAGGTVTLSGRAVPEGYEVAVSDTGVGIPEEHLGRIFERFYRVDKARDRATGGTGLGLSIVKHTVEAHGGTVRVRSVVGEGSVFAVFFPQPPNGYHR